MLIVRNSFLVINKIQEQATKKLGFEIIELFKPTEQLINSLVIRESASQLSLAKEKEELEIFYEHIKEVTAKIDITLSEHTEALQVRALEKIDTLEKKMLRAEKRKFEAQQRQLGKLRKQLFYGNSLQERVDNFSPFYAKYGKEWLNKIYNASLSLEQKFGILGIE